MQFLLSTEIMCHSAEDAHRIQQLGLDASPEEQWMKISLDLRHIVAVRENVEEDGFPQCTVYTPCDNFTIKGEYNEILARWIQAKAE